MAEAPLPYLSDAELDGICRPLKQHAAQVRYLQGLGLQVDRRPDGSPLVRRADWERARSPGQAKATGGPKWSVPA